MFMGKGYCTKVGREFRRAQRVGFTLAPAETLVPNMADSCWVNEICENIEELEFGRTQALLMPWRIPKRSKSMQVLPCLRHRPKLMPNVLRIGNQRLKFGLGPGPACHHFTAKICTLHLHVTMTVLKLDEKDIKKIQKGSEDTKPSKV